MWGTICGLYKFIWVSNDFFKVKVSFHFKVLRKNIWFSLPVPKIKFDPPPQGKCFEWVGGWSGGVVEVGGWWCVGDGRVGGVRVGVGLVGGLVLMAQGPPHYSLV